MNENCKCEKSQIDSCKECQEEFSPQNDDEKEKLKTSLSKIDRIIDDLSHELDLTYENISERLKARLLNSFNEIIKLTNGF